MFLPQGIVGHKGSTGLMKEVPVYPMLKEVRKEAFKNLSLAFREFNHLNAKREGEMEEKRK